MANQPLQAAQREKAIRDSFLRFHDEYLETWRDGLARGDATNLLSYYQHVHSTLYARPGWNALEPVTREQNIEGKRQTVEALRGSRLVVADRAVLVRSESEVVVFYRKTIESDDRRFTAFMMQVWRRAAADDENWTLVRGTTEK